MTQPMGRTACRDCMLMPSHWTIFVMVVLVPLGIAAFLGSRTFGKMTPLAFECRRCGRMFEHAAWRGFPRRCAHCRARDWNG